MEYYWVMVWSIDFDEDFSIWFEAQDQDLQYKGDPWRILFAFDPERHAILLVGGDKTGNSRWYKINIPIADARFEKHLLELRAKETERNAQAQKENRK